MKLWKHQNETVKLGKKTPIMLDTSSPGTGKTFSHLTLYDQLRKSRKASKLLILCPKSLMESAWGDTLAEHFPHLLVSKAYATNRRQAFSMDAHVYITNIDAVKWLAEQKKKFWKGFNYLIIDESSAYKHRTSQRSKAAAKIMEHFRYRRLLSGTPTSNTITDIWHQVLLLDDGDRLGRNFFRFRDSVCNCEATGPQGRFKKWTDKEGAVEAVAGILQDISIRHQFEDCMDIPPNHRSKVFFDLPPRLQAAYDTMVEENILELRDNPVVGINAAVVANKLLQICSGAVYGIQNSTVLSTARNELVMDLIDERDHSLVFFNWSHQKDELTKLAKKRKYEHAIIDGTVPDKERTRIVRAYQNGDYKTLFLHPKTGAHGLTLTRGTTTIIASPFWEADYIEQAIHRIYRGGQTQATNTIFVTARNTLEEQMYDRVFAKEQRMHDLLQLLKAA